MIENNLKTEIHKKAVSAWLEANKKGTFEVSTGIGKTFISLHCLYTMEKNQDVHLFLAETTQRKTDLLKDIEFYNKLFKVDVLNDYNLKFVTYQTAYKWENKNFGLVIADEILFA